MRKLLLSLLALLAFTPALAQEVGTNISNPPASLPPSGAAGGDLGGTYPNPTVLSVADVTTGVLAGANGGTGVANTGKTITLGGNHTNSGAFNSTFIIPGTGSWTFPVAGSSLAPLASPTFTGTVTIPTPFTLGAVSVTSTGTQLNYLNAATGTTGTTSTNLVFSAAPTFTGAVTLGNGTAGTPSLNFGDATTGFYRRTTNVADFSLSGTGIFEFEGGSGILFKSDYGIGWSSGLIGSARDIGLFRDSVGALRIAGAAVSILSVPATDNLQLGAAAVDTAPVAQTLSMQNTLAGGTSNVAGANFTLAMSQGKGTGVGGSFILQVAPAGGSGTAVNALATALTIDSTKAATFTGDINLATAKGVNWLAHDTEIFSEANGTIRLWMTTARRVEFNQASKWQSIPSDWAYGFGSGTTVSNPDTVLSRISAGIVGVGLTAAGQITGGLQAATVALGGATIGSNALVVTGTSAFTGDMTMTATQSHVWSANTFSLGGSTGTVLAVVSNGTGTFALSSSQGIVAGSLGIGFTSGLNSAADVRLTRRGTANLNLGAADAAAPVAQTLSVQSVVAGTSNTAGAVTSIIGSLATGNALSGNVRIYVGKTLGSGTTQQTATPALEVTYIDVNGAASLNLGQDLLEGFNTNGSSRAIDVYTNNVLRSRWNVAGQNLGPFVLGFNTGVNSTFNVGLSYVSSGVIGVGLSGVAAAVDGKMQMAAITMGASSLTLTTGAIGMSKMTASASAPGAGGAKEEWVCGTAAGSLKKIAYAGTSTTPVTIIDNVGSGATGC